MGDPEPGDAGAKQHSRDDQSDDSEGDPEIGPDRWRAFFRGTRVPILTC
jgi:hypothetical protein